jgi:hypothetical protein
MDDDRRRRLRHESNTGEAAHDDAVEGGWTRRRRIEMNERFRERLGIPITRSPHNAALEGVCAADLDVPLGSSRVKHLEEVRGPRSESVG